MSHIGLLLAFYLGHCRLFLRFHLSLPHEIYIKINSILNLFVDLAKNRVSIHAEHSLPAEWNSRDSKQSCYIFPLKGIFLQPINPIFQWSKDMSGCLLIPSPPALHIISQQHPPVLRELFHQRWCEPGGQCTWHCRKSRGQTEKEIGS